MNPTVVDVLGQDYFLISHSGACDGDSLPEFDGVTVILTPSLSEDFCVRPYFHGRELYSDKAASVTAAAHLALVRGLPLAEYEFKTSGGIDEIHYTGNGVFGFKLLKCKQLFTDTVEVLGCPTSCTDVFVDRVYRVVHTNGLLTADRSALLPLITAGRYLPDAVLFSSVESGELKILPYTDYNPSPPSRLMLCSAAAFSYRGKERALSFYGGRLRMDIGYSVIEASLKIEIK